ncbi:hypothetical protein CLOP_g14258, partial [Closterium sp. NIES-67]
LATCSANGIVLIPLASSTKSSQ